MRVRGAGAARAFGGLADGSGVLPGAAIDAGEDPRSRRVLPGLAVGAGIVRRTPVLPGPALRARVRRAGVGDVNGDPPDGAGCACRRACCGDGTCVTPCAADQVIPGGRRGRVLPGDAGLTRGRASSFLVLPRCARAARPAVGPRVPSIAHAFGLRRSAGGRTRVRGARGTRRCRHVSRVFSCSAPLAGALGHSARGRRGLAGRALYAHREGPHQVPRRGAPVLPGPALRARRAGVPGRTRRLRAGRSAPARSDEKDHREHRARTRPAQCSPHGEGRPHIPSPERSTLGRVLAAQKRTFQQVLPF